MKKELISLYKTKKKDIRHRLEDFKSLSKDQYYKEFIFCLLTPQSNAKKCWEAVEQLSKISDFNKENVSNTLKTKTRFHNNKTLYILESKKTWESIKHMLEEKDRIKLRNYLADNVKGFGLKEAGHFLRNTGHSNNQIAILDRHILRNLKALKVIEEDKIKNAKKYLEIEQKFLTFSKKIRIPIDELDLLFWSKENREIFK